MATLKELADRTGCSPAAISRILNADPTLSVSDETRRKVLEEAGRMNYSASKSRRGRTPKPLMRVGLAEMLSTSRQLDDPYFLYLGNQVRQGCQERKYACIPVEHRGGAFVLPEGERVDGIVAVGYFPPEEIQALELLSDRVVFVDFSPDEVRYDSVELSYELGIRQALTALVSLGHRSIAFAGPDRRPYGQPGPEPRYEAFLHLTPQLGLERRQVFHCPMQGPGIQSLLYQALSREEERPTALLCANEEIAMGAVRAAQQLEIPVPKALSIVSFNDTPRSALVRPALTSVSVHTAEMANAALRLLADRVMGGPPEPRSWPQKVTVPPSLSLRDSTAPSIR